MIGMSPPCVMTAAVSVRNETGTHRSCVAQRTGRRRR
jgi:hypothetical protein